MPWKLQVLWSAWPECWDPNCKNSMCFLPLTCLSSLNLLSKLDPSGFRETEVLPKSCILGEIWIHTWGSSCHLCWPLSAFYLLFPLCIGIFSTTMQVKSHESTWGIYTPLSLSHGFSFMKCLLPLMAMIFHNWGLHPLTSHTIASVVSLLEFFLLLVNGWVCPEEGQSKCSSYSIHFASFLDQIFYTLP